MKRTLDKHTPGHRVPDLDALVLKQEDGTLRSSIADMMGSGVPSR
jgi:hypothetical protein